MIATKLYTVPAAIALAALVVGCGPSRPTFKADGYHDADRAYQIVSVDGSGALLSPTKWSLTNYENIDGRVGNRKDTADYAVWQKFDTTGDGTPDSEMRQALYDVLLVSREGPAKMWVRTEPVPTAKGKLALEDLARNYLEGVAEHGTLPAALGKPFKAAGKWTVKEITGFAATLDGAAAYEITFDYAADEAGLAEGTRARIVMVDPGFTTKLGDLNRKTVLIATYTNTVADFGANLETFENLVGRIALLTHEELVQNRSKEIFECRGTNDEIKVEVKLNDKWEIVEAFDSKEGEVVEDAGRTCASVILSDAPFRLVDPKTVSVRLTPGPVSVPAGGYARDTPPEPPEPPAPPAPAAPADGEAPAEGAEGAAPADGAAPAEGAAAPPPPEPAP